MALSMTLKRILRIVGWGSAVLALLAGTAAIALHMSGAQRLRRARASFAREVMPLVRSESCPYARTDPRNGASWYLAAAKSLRTPTPELAALGKSVRHPPGTWSAADVQRITSILEAQQKALGWAHAGALRPACDLAPTSVLSADENFAPSLFRLSNLLLAEAGLELRRGNQERTTSATDTLEALGLGLQRGPFIVQELLGTVVMGSYLRALNWLVESDAASVATLKALRTRLPRGSAHEIIARALADEGSLVFVSTHDAGFHRGIMGFCCADKTAASMLDEYRDLVSWTSLTYREVGQAVAHWKHKDTDDWAGADPLSTIGKCQAVEASRQLAAIALDLRIGAAVSGDFPAQLPAAQADLVDPFAGAHPVYSKAAWGPQVSNPAAAAEYRELNTRATAPPFGWRLPAPAGQPPV